MKTILRILELAGGYHRDLHLRIENPPYMALVIEAVMGSGPSGEPTLSVAHYGEQGDDLMRDPEMCFEILRSSGKIVSLSPYYYRNDYLGVEQYSRSSGGKHRSIREELYGEHRSFALQWDRNLRNQGFVDAFERSRNQ